MQLKPFSVAIFDMDGTVLDSMPIWDHLADHFLLKQGRTPKPELREALRALNMKATAEYLKEQYALLQTGEEIAHALNVLAAEEYAKKAGLKPGIIAYLTALQKKGVRMAIATATDRMIALPTLQRLGLMKFFDALLTCTEEGVDKNTPEIYMRAARAVGANPPKGCVVFEDALHCIRTLKKSGFYTVAVKDDSAAYAWKEICEIADEHIDSYDELLEE